MNYRLYINNDGESIIFYHKNHALLWKSLNFNFGCSWVEAHPLVVSYKRYDNLNVIDSKKKLVSDTKKIVAMQILLSLVLL